ncbi:MAG: hypothetical protein HKM04_07320 [Legionellales bacterium]|nr:hypothetical protein [Legionellales bacterium]
MDLEEVEATLVIKNVTPSLPTVILNELRAQLFAGKSIIFLDALLYLTKGRPNYTSAILFRDNILEERVKLWIETKTSFKKKMDWYKNYDNNLWNGGWPLHYAMNIVKAEGCLSDNNNIFMFFPDALGVSSAEISDYFGMEFIDIWSFVFDEVIFPCAKRVLKNDSLLFSHEKLKPYIKETIYLASVFHEIGHRAGYFKVSPQKDYRVKISKFHTDVLGELSTDTLLILALSEFQELSVFIVLQRLFWYGRSGFKKNNKRGLVNSDNDSWIGSFLFNIGMQTGLFNISALKLGISFEKIEETFKKIDFSLRELGEELITIDSQDQQDNIVREWMKRHVDSDEDGFIIPEQFQKILGACLDIKEKPSIKFA